MRNILLCLSISIFLFACRRDQTELTAIEKESINANQPNQVFDIQKRPESFRYAAGKRKKGFLYRLNIVLDSSNLKSVPIPEQRYDRK
jgi:hypothetical protein